MSEIFYKSVFIVILETFMRLIMKYNKAKFCVNLFNDVYYLIFLMGYALIKKTFDIKGRNLFLVTFNFKRSVGLCSIIFNVQIFTF